MAFGLEHARQRLAAALADGFGIAGIILALLAAVALVTGSYLVGCKKPYTEPRYATPNPDLPRYSPLPGVKQTLPHTIQKKLRCDSPGSKEEYELCQPWRQAEAAEDAACTAKWQFVAGMVGLGIIFVTFFANAIAAWGAKSAADIARDTLIASQRAWIRRAKTSMGAISVHQDGSMTAGISLELVNKGNAPALHLSLHARLIAPTNAVVPVRQAEAFFDEVGAKPFERGYSLLPDEIFPANIDLLTLTFITERLTAAEVAAATDPNGCVGVYVAGCVDYTFPTDIKMHHQTAFLLEVVWGRGPGGLLMVRPGRNFPSDDLRLQAEGFGGMTRVT